jgi:hypothetical protein
MFPFYGNLTLALGQSVEQQQFLSIMWALCAADGIGKFHRHCTDEASLY